MKKYNDLKNWKYECLEQEWERLNGYDREHLQHNDLLLCTALAQELDRRDEIIDRDIDTVMDVIIKDEDERALLDELGVEELWDYQINGDLEEKFNVMLTGDIIERLTRYGRNKKDKYEFCYDELQGITHWIVHQDVPSRLQILP